MRYFGRKTDSSRYPADVGPVIQCLLENRQVFGPEQQGPPFVTDILKYSSQRQDRRATSEYDGDDEFVKNVADILGFNPLQF
jgi:hypothetical protein